MIEKEEFEVWRGHPVTKVVMEVLKAEAQSLRAVWMAKSFDGGNCNERLRDDLFGRYQTAMDLYEFDHGDLLKAVESLEMWMPELEGGQNDEPERD